MIVFLAKHPDSKTVALVNSKMAFPTASWKVEKKQIFLSKRLLLQNKFYEVNMNQRLNLKDCYMTIAILVDYS